MFGMDQSYFETNFNRASLPIFQALLKLPGDDAYALLPPILFADNKSDSPKRLFKNLLLPRVSSCLFILQIDISKFFADRKNHAFW